VAGQAAEELGLAVAIVPEGDVKLGHALGGHDRPEEHDRVVRTVDGDEEVRAGEAEDDADVVLGKKNGVDNHAVLLAHQRDHER